MKNFTFFLAFLHVAFFSIALTAQSWLEQHAIGLPNSVNPTMTLSAVDSNICWGVNFENSKFIRTTDGGINWLVSTITGANGLYGSCIFAIDSSTAYAAMNDPSGTTSGGIFKTTNGGSSWTKQDSAFLGSSGFPVYVHFFDANDGVAIGNPHNGNWEIYTTTDGGTQWTQVTNIPAPFGNEFTGGGYSSVDDNIWFGTFGDSFAIYRSTDRGYTWTRSTGAGSVSFCIAFKDEMNGLTSNCFGGLGNRVSKTINGGLNWNNLSGIPATPSTYFISYSNDDSVGYVVTSNSNIGLPVATFPGSMRSADGTNWTQIDNLPHGPASFANDGSGWSGGLNDIIYKWIPPITGIEDDFYAVSDFKLFQNYPNPFNPSTTIRYSIPASEFVTLKVYDVLGNEVATLVNEEKPAGSYETEFNAVGLSSGIYFYQLQAGNFTQTKKLILMK